MNAAGAEALERCLAGGGVAVIPTDTVYGLACDAGDEPAISRMHAVKGRERPRPAALMFFSMAAAAGSLTHLGPRTREAVHRLLPGPVTLLLPDPGDPAGERALGLRVPHLDAGLAPLAAVRRPVLQTSANPTGAPEARRLADIPTSIRRAVDLVLDGGELPGVASTVVDLRPYEGGGGWEVVREAAFTRAQLERALSSPGP